MPMIIFFTQNTRSILLGGIFPANYSLFLQFINRKQCFPR